jgi:pantothenate synthetase
MSSRNRLLTAEQRISASKISAILLEVRKIGRKMEIPDLKKFVITHINMDPNLQTEYFELVLESDLIPLEKWPKNMSVQACIAVKTGTVRLIDNIKFS